MGYEQPVERVFGVTSSDETMPSGHPVVRQALLPQVLDEDGALPVGAMCILVDHGLGGGIAAQIRDDQRMVTSHMHLEVLHPVVGGIPWIGGFADDVRVAGTSAFARGRITDDRGRLVAWSSARFALIEAAGGEGGNVAAHPAEAGAKVVSADRGPVAPIDDLLGRVVRSRTRDGVELTFVASEDLANERGGLHGGVGALMGERAMRVALLEASGGDGLDLVELRVGFLRPVPASGQPIDVHAEVLMLGRTTAATSARVLRADGKVAVQVDAIHSRR